MNFMSKIYIFSNMIFSHKKKTHHLLIFSIFFLFPTHTIYFNGYKTLAT